MISAPGITWFACLPLMPRLHQRAISPTSRSEFEVGLIDVRRGDAEQSDRVRAAGERDRRGGPGTGSDMNVGAERRRRDAKSADIHQIRIGRRARVGGEVGDDILTKIGQTKIGQELEGVVAWPAGQRVVPQAPSSVSLPAPPTRRLSNSLPVSDRPVAPAFARRNSIS
jgi:hypothetical protein